MQSACVNESSVRDNSVHLMAGICRLRLRHLDFSCNRIAHIPCDIRRVDTLERLSLDNNPLLSPPAAVSLHDMFYATWQYCVHDDTAFICH